MLKVGFAQADITPTMGKDLSGGFARRGNWPVHDPLRTVACVIDNGETAIALVGADAVVVGRHIVEAARAQIASDTSIRADHILIAASHTHQGGPVLSTLTSTADPRYERQVQDGIVSAATAAWNSRRDAEIGIATGSIEGITFNRRFLMRDGKHVTHPGKLHPDIVRPAGPIDSELGILAARDAKGQIIGVIINFACHATVVGGESFSADYIYYVREHLRRHLGSDTAVVFLAGASGDVTQVDNQRPGNDFGHELGDRMGAALAQEAAKIVQSVQWQNSVPLRVAQQNVEIAVKDRDADEERPALGLGSGNYWEEIFIRERQEVAKLRQRTPGVQCELMAMRIGDLDISANPAELFCQCGLDIKAASRIHPTWVVTLANGYCGYVPTATAYYAGGYEPRTARSSFLAVDAAQKIVEGSLHLVSMLSGNL